MRWYSNKRIPFVIVSLCLSVSLNAKAKECEGIYLKDSKSSGMLVKKNNCLNLPHLSIGSVIELAPKGRLWLKSIPKNDDRPRHQLICQNRSNASLELNFSDPSSPWLSLLKLGHCADWVNNKLSCNDKSSKKLALYCVLPPIQEKLNTGTDTVMRTTSVKMRTLSPPTLSPENKKMLSIIHSELQLCKELSQVSQEMKIEWSVETNKTTHIQSITLDDALSRCTEAVIRTYPYPEFSEKKIFSSTY